MGELVKKIQLKNSEYVTNFYYKKTTQLKVSQVSNDSVL